LLELSISGQKDLYVFGKLVVQTKPSNGIIQLGEAENLDR
jgi:hypothetical protein